MVYTHKVREIEINLQGRLEDLTEEEESELMRAVEILRKIEASGAMKVRISEFDGRVRVLSREILALVEAIRTQWCLVSDLQEATGLSRELVMRHMAKITKLRPDLFEYTKTIPKPTKTRKGQAWRIREGRLQDVEQMRKQGRQDHGL